MNSMNKPKIKILYVTDPQCAWCFGIADELSKLSQRFKGEPSVKFDVIPGGLFSPPLSIHPNFVESKRPMFERIEQLFNVKFGADFYTNLTSEMSALDSEVPSRVLVTVKSLKREVIFPFMADMLKAQFVNGNNISIFENIIEVIESYGFDLHFFTKTFYSDAMKKETQNNFHKARKLSKTYPAIFIEMNGDITEIPEHARSFIKLEKSIESLMKQSYPLSSLPNVPCPYLTVP